METHYERIDEKENDEIQCSANAGSTWFVADPRFSPSPGNRSPRANFQRFYFLRRDDLRRDPFPRRHTSSARGERTDGSDGRFDRREYDDHRKPRRTRIDLGSDAESVRRG